MVWSTDLWDSQACMAGGHKRVKNQSSVMFPEEQSTSSNRLQRKGYRQNDGTFEIYAPYYDCFCQFRQTSEENEVWNEVLKDKTHWTIKEHLELTYCNT